MNKMDIKEFDIEKFNRCVEDPVFSGFSIYASPIQILKLYNFIVKGWDGEKVHLIKYNDGIVFSKSLFQKLYDIRLSPIEWAGLFFWDGRQLQYSFGESGSDMHVNLKQKVSKYMFHSHPPSLEIPYSFFSGDDIARYLRDCVAYVHRGRIDYLVTEKGILSIRISDDLIDIYKKIGDPIKNICVTIQNYAVDRYLLGKGLDGFVSILAWSNKVSGAWIERNIRLLNADDLVVMEKHPEFFSLSHFYTIVFNGW